MNADYMKASLYVGDLNPSVTELMLAQRFCPAGPIHSVYLCRDRKTGSSLGYAFINFHQQADAERAVELFNFELLAGVPMRVMHYERDSSARKTGLGNLFIKHLDKSIDNMALFDTFSIFGKVLSCKVVRYDTGSKGYGYVQFESVEAAELAKKMLNGKLLNDRQVLIEHFKVRDERKAEQNSKQVYMGRAQTRVDRQTEQFNQKLDQGLNLYIKNLDSLIDDECLHTVFSQFGTVINAKVIMENGRSRGFGFVRFSSLHEAMKAKKEMNGKMWGRKAVYVGVAQRKEERQAYSAHQITQRMAMTQLNSVVDISQPVPPPCYFVNTITPSSGQVPCRSEDSTTVTATSVGTAPVADTVPFAEFYPAVDYVPAVDTDRPVDSVPSVSTVSTVHCVPAVDVVPAGESFPAVDPDIDSVQLLSSAEDDPSTTLAPDADEAPSTSVTAVGDVQQDKNTTDVSTAPPVSKQLTVYMLDSIPEDDQIQMAYDYILPLVEKIHPIQANKITWMLLEGENNFEIMSMVRDPELLRARVDEMDALLKASEAEQEPEALRMLYNSNKKRRKKKKRKNL